ncbi:unnamed protein product [Auanema sp. JU1783]|nr:unnamed protein product [Auanema sp. JU1783]
MSTTPSKATEDLSIFNPSCSYVPDDQICPDLLDGIFAHVARIAPIKKALELKKINAQAERSITRALARNNHLRIDIHEPAQYRMIGLNREKIKHPDPIIYIQGSHVPAAEAEAILLLILKDVTILKRLSITVEDPDLTNLDLLLDHVIKCERVKLEVLQVHRRKGGQSIPKIAQLIKANAKTLKVIGRIGLQEAAEGCVEEMKLDRLSLMTFDLGLDASSNRIFDNLATIIRSKVTFKHLSYTSFIGFDPTDELIQNFLDACGVQSLRLTMMKGPYISPQPEYMVGKVRRVQHIEMGEVVDKPNIFNSLITYEKIFLKVFPNVDDIHYFQQW